MHSCIAPVRFLWLDFAFNFHTKRMRLEGKMEQSKPQVV